MRHPGRSTTLAIATLVAAAASCADGDRLPSDSIAAPRAGMELVFDADFDGDSLGPEWSTCLWWQVDGGCTITSEMPEQQWYRPEAVTVADGVVTLTATADEQRATDGRLLPFRSGVITTGPRDNEAESSGFAFTHGYVEARVRFPAGGTAVWPAVWLLSADRESLPEIDLMEWYGTRHALVTGHVHQRIDGERASRRLELPVDDPSDGWHEVALSWEAGRVEIFFNSTSMGVIEDETVPTTPMYLIINLAVGGRSGEPDPTQFPQAFQVDWIRVWQ